MKSPTLAVCILVSAISMVSSETTASESGEAVPFARLISHTTEYDGQVVAVYGYLRYRHHGKALFPSREAAEYGFLSSAFWLEATADTVIKAEGRRARTLFELDGEYVLITGVVNIDGHGFKGAYSAAISDIREVIVLRRSK